MRPTRVLLTTIALLISLVGVREATAAPSDSGAYHIVFPRRALGAGERVELRVEPSPPTGVRVNWTVAGLGNNHMVGLSLPLYRAPYVIPEGTSPAKVSASFSVEGVWVGVLAEIELRPSSVPGAEDCLGPGEAFSAVWGDIEFTGNFYVGTLPDLIHRVEPVYPRSDFVRGVQDTVLINALVCRSGRVLDAYPIPRFRRATSSATGGWERTRPPVQYDPKLVEAATTAVRQYLFDPAKTADGQATAVWVAVLVRFTH